MGLFSWLFPRRGRPPLGPIPDPPPRQPAPALVRPASVLALVNAARARVGRSALRPSGQLDTAAAAGCSLLALGGSWHRGFAQRIAASGFPALAAGECEAAGRATAAEAVDAWLSDPAHRRILLGDYTHLGWASAAGRDGRPVWCCDVARHA